MFSTIGTAFVLLCLLAGVAVWAATKLAEKNPEAVAKAKAMLAEFLTPKLPSAPPDEKKP